MGRYWMWGGEILYYLRNCLKNRVVEGIGIESDPAECIFMKDHDLNYIEKFVDPNCADKEIETCLQSADIVSFINVLEHIEDPEKYIDYLYCNLKMNALIVFEVPKHPSVASFANLTSRNHVYRHIVPPIHLQIFSKKSIDNLLKEKFEILGEWEFGQGFSDLINNAMILSDQKCNRLYEKMLMLNNEVQRTIDRQGMGDQILVVARKRGKYE